MRQISLLILTLLIGVSNAQTDFSGYIINTPSAFNFSSDDVVVYQSIPYDVDDTIRQSLDLFIPADTGYHPLIIKIHGGGFTSGSKDDQYNSGSARANIKSYVDQGIAFAAINYRYIASAPDLDTSGVIKPLGDALRALQFLRYHDTDLRIKSNSIVLQGGSAGAGTSLWLATHDEMADPNASDPIKKESSRVCGAHITNSQATYDVNRWAGEVFETEDINSMIAMLSETRYNNFYGGIDSNYHPYKSVALIQYRQNVDMLDWLSSDDPPIYNESNKDNGAFSADPLHHPNHALTISNYAQAAGLKEFYNYIPSLNLDNTNGETGEEFLIRLALAGCEQNEDINADTISIIDTITYFDTTSIAINDTIQVYDTLLVFDTITIQNSDTLVITLNNFPTKIDDLIQATVKAYPNPSSNELNINISKVGSYTVQLFNNIGQIELEKNINSNSTALNISDLSKGIYILKITDNNNLIESNEGVILIQ